MRRHMLGWSMVLGMFILSVSAFAAGRLQTQSPSTQQQAAKQQAANQQAANQQAEPRNQAQLPQIPNPQIDPLAFLNAATKAVELRKSRRVTEEEFIRMSHLKGAVILDARSKNRFEQIHIEGAMSLPFTDFTIDSLAEQLPDKSVTILIYCNNNFRGNVPEFPSKSIGSALNLSTFSSLYDYGYRNVYELGPELDLATTKLKLVGPSAAKYVK